MNQIGAESETFNRFIRKITPRRPTGVYEYQKMSMEIDFHVRLSEILTYEMKDILHT